MNKIVVDLSTHNGNVNMVKLKNSGIYGIIQRVGYGSNTIDDTARKNINNALKAGLKVGCYWFMYSLNTEQALQEAKNFNNFLLQYKGKLELPIYCDFEYDTERYAKQNGVYFDRKSRTEIIHTFLNYLQLQGWYVGNYANSDYIKNKLNNLDKYDLWLAYWSKTPSPLLKKCGLWQYSSSGRLPGITGNVDTNQLLKDYPTIIKQNKLNGFGNVATTHNPDYLSVFAYEVLKGAYGNGNDRIKNIYNTVQNEVNNLLHHKPVKNNYITDTAKDVIKGNYGIGVERKNNLYKAIQAKVNKMV